MTRAFVAVRPPDTVLDAIEARCAAVELPGGRRTTRDQWHLTLQFLGNEVDVDAAASALHDLQIRPAKVGLSGAGTLPPERRARYLVLFARDGDAWLRTLGDAVAERLAPLGYERDHQDFVPHLTLARFRTRTDLREVCAAIGAEPIGPPWKIDVVTVYESLLRPTGAEYVAQATVPLGTG